MKILAILIGIIISLFGLFVISVCIDALFSGEAESGVGVIVYLIFLILFGFVPYLFGAFVCFWGWMRGRQIDSKSRVFLKTLFSFERRINRRPFWLINLLMLGPYVILDLQRTKETVSGVPPLGIAGTMLIFLVFLLWPSLAIQIKRWHDIDKSGYWVFMNLVPIIGIIVQIVMCGFKKGTDGPNNYGQSPLSPDRKNSLDNPDNTQADSLSAS